MPRVTIEQAALGYVARGVPVLPLYGIKDGKCACGRDCGRDAGKHPHSVLVPHGVKDASADPGQAGRWFRAYPEGELNLGLALRDLVALDEDQAGAVLAAGLELPNCPTSKTGRGQHMLFAANGHTLPNGRFVPGVDCKSGEAYVVAPPSMHISGKRYAWVAGHSLDDLEPPPLPEAVEQLIVAAHAGSAGNGTKDPLHDIYGNLKLEEVFLELETLEQGAVERWRKLMLAAIRSLIARGLRDDLIVTMMRRATRLDLGYRHQETDKWVGEQIRLTRRKDKRPEPDEEDEATFKQNDQTLEQASDPWPEPLDILGAPELTGWPELTPECLPATLYAYIAAEADRLGVDPCPLAGHVLAACSTSISDAWRVKPLKHNHWTQGPRIWSCVIKDVGARGTDMIRSAFWPLAQRDKALFADWKRQHAAWQQREAARKKPDPTDPEPVCRRTQTSDVTVEKASDILAGGDEHAKLALVCDELVAFFGSFNRYSAAASTRAQWLEGYDGGPRWIDRVKRGQVYVPNWSIVVAGNIQPRRLARIGTELTDDGLFQRFLTIHARPIDPEEDDLPGSPDAGHAYQALHKALAQLRPVIGLDGEIKPVWFDDEARAERARFMPLIRWLRFDGSLPLVIRETASKWSGLLPRLALIYHLVELAERVRQGDRPEPRELHRITGLIVTGAATFLRRVALPNLFRLGFEALPDEGSPAIDARWLAGHMLANPAEKITAREIGRVYRRLRGKHAEIADAMGVLCDAGWARPIDARRHDSAQWATNPAIHTVFAKAATAEKERRAQVSAAVRARAEALR